MAKAKAVTYFSVKGGLNTEANPLNMPPEDCVDILNCNINLDGSIERRAGIDFVKVDGGDKTSTEFTYGRPQNAFTFTTDSYVTSGGGSYNKFLLVKSGRDVHIYLYVSVTNLETATPFQTITLEDGSHEDLKTTFASFGDKVVLTNQAMQSIYIKILGNAFVLERDGIYIRDLNESVPTTDSVVSKEDYAYKCIRSHYPEDVRTTPGTGTDWRKYWVLLGPKTDETAWASGTAGNYQYAYIIPDVGYFRKDYYRAIQNSTNQYPPDSPTYWEFVGYSNPIAPTAVGAWSAVTAYTAPGGSTTMPSTYVSKAVTYNSITYYEEYYSLQPHATMNPGVTAGWRDYWEYLGVYESTIFPAWTANSGVAPLVPTYTSSIRETHEVYDIDSGFLIGCFSSGRLWMVGNTNARNSVYVSQSVVRGDEFNRMYQFADPYSKTDSTIVDTDGAVIVITEASNIKSIVPYNFGVLVFAENGVWYIGGSDGFKTTLISIQKISDIGVASTGAVTSVESGIVFFGNNGIYGIKESVSGSGFPEAQDIGEKIQSYYTAITNTSRTYAEAIFDKLNKRLYYFYYAGGISLAHNSCLVLDTRTGSWFKHSFNSTAGAIISHFVQTPNASTESELIFVMQRSGGTWGFGKFTPTVWSDFTGTTAEKYTFYSYITMSHQTYGTVIRKREATYLTTVFERLEPDFDGSCKMRVDWNWSRTTASPYFGTARQVYFPNKYITSLYNDTLNGLETVVTKHKIRGWGNVFRFHFESEGDMPFKLLGWELLVEVDPTP